MTNPITPPPELLRKWCAHNSEHESYEQFWHYIAAQSAQWGADQELEACCEWLKGDGWCGSMARLRAARRPNLPSLKDRALKSLDGLALPDDAFETIRFALEALPDE